MLLKCFSIVQRATFLLLVYVLISFSTVTCWHGRGVKSWESPGVRTLGVTGSNLRVAMYGGETNDSSSPCWEMDDFSLEMDLGFLEWLTGLDTGPGPPLHRGGMGNLGIPVGDHLAQHRTWVTQCLVFNYYEWKSAWLSPRFGRI